MLDEYSRGKKDGLELSEAVLMGLQNQIRNTDSELYKGLQKSIECIHAYTQDYLDRQVRELNEELGCKKLAEHLGITLFVAHGLLNKVFHDAEAVQKYEKTVHCKAEFIGKLSEKIFITPIGDMGEQIGKSYILEVRRAGYEDQG